MSRPIFAFVLFFSVFLACTNPAPTTAPADMPVPPDLAASPVDLAPPAALAPPPPDLSADLAPAPDPAGPAICRGPGVAGACVQSFFLPIAQCFRPSGECTFAQTQSGFDQCWASGAYLKS